MDFTNRIPRSSRRERAKRLLKQVGMEFHADKCPAALSGGEQQRVAIGRALANDPGIFLLMSLQGTYGTIYLFAVQDFSNLKVDTFSLEKGEFPNTSTQMALERDSLKILSNIKQGYNENVPVKLPGRKKITINMSGTGGTDSRLRKRGISP